MSDFLLFIAVGFAAQIIDGAIGMAYGLASTSVLLGLGFTPAVASASVHAAEVFTTGASALSHWRFGNVRWKMVGRLAIPGAVGGTIGAMLLSSMDGGRVRPVVAFYLAAMGLWIVWKAARRANRPSVEPRMLPALGLVGGFLDSIGGGGWGPIVTSSIIGQGAVARTAIGSTNASEFLVTLMISGTFFLTVGLELWPIILGLIVGGVIAAPLAALVVRHMPDRPMMMLVGVLITLLSGREFVRVFGI
ncbi:sulfite exporter TauE/SafE family protein [Oricola cellulosilytica]|uniref:Probable membrane transporter protein n=1 Tax=Oricola cellulosilytica TaxID=1429082 RepID=A0A4R0PI37_9HYPH|nr:sulfite exporter TauE/SafE family protein [Oricola cellulosilytica]TCD15214.1 sulfite exporter TauE/SafE family protein [Oricola cellulosilytica]